MGADNTAGKNMRISELNDMLWEEIRAKKQNIKVQKDRPLIERNADDRASALVSQMSRKRPANQEASSTIREIEGRNKKKQRTLVLAQIRRRRPHAFDRITTNPMDNVLSDT